MFQTVYDRAHKVCNANQLDFVYDSYVEHSTKELERVRRAKLVDPLSYEKLTENTPVPVQIDRFWAANKNKEHLQILSRDYFIMSAKLNLKIVLSGYVNDASGIQECVQANQGVVSNRSDLQSNIEEADGRIIPHSKSCG